MRKQSSPESKAPWGDIRGALGVILPLPNLYKLTYFVGIYPTFAKPAMLGVNFKINKLRRYRATFATRPGSRAKYSLDAKGRGGEGLPWAREDRGASRGTSDERD